jgi:peptidoglycan/xylan/chitin deacetylase (PgdA/CDA1 family)
MAARGWWPVGVAVLLATTITLSGGAAVPVGTQTDACALPSELIGLDVEAIPTSRHIVALTFDAGSSKAGVPKIRRVLDRHDAPATFFLTGAFVERYPVPSQNLAREHVIGNHSATHPDLTTLDRAAVRREVTEAEQVIVGVTGENPRPYFRFPFGARDTRTIRVVNNRCYVAVRWTVDTLGWQGTSGGRSVSSVVQTVRHGLQPGAIVLMHVGANPDDGSTLDADALGQIIRLARSEGYRLVPLTALLPEAP